MTEPLIIRVTERGTFKRCRKRWDYSSPSRQNLRPIGTPIALQFGRMVHEAHEKWLVQPSADPVHLFTLIAKDELERIKERYNKATGTWPNEQELEGFYDHVELGRDMMHSYKSKWGSALPDGFQLVDAEQTVQVPVPGVPNAYLQGSFDALIKSAGGEYFILERKTYGQRPRSDTLETNDQFLAYLWLLDRLDIGPIGGIYYDGMWKRKLEGKRTLDDLFMRTMLTRPRHEIDLFGEYLTNEVLDMIGEPRIYLNRRWEGCHDCPYERLCTAEAKGEDADYIRRTSYTTDSEAGDDFTQGEPVLHTQGQ